MQPRIFQIRVDLIPILFSGLLLLGLFSPFFLFFSPAAVAVVMGRWNLFGIIFSVTVLALHIFRLPSAQYLEVATFLLLWLFGSANWFFIRKKVDFIWFVFFPMVLAIGVVGILWILGGYSWSLTNWLEWSAKLVNDTTIPVIQEMKEIPETLGTYQRVVLPMLQRGFLGWYTFVFSLVFFINAAIENMVRHSKIKPWRQFPKWKVHDFALVILVLALAVLAYSRLKALPLDSSWTGLLGLNLLILVSFPILIQGAAVASFIIPRLSMFLFILVFALLLIEPLPVLLLAGFCDLWFDLRAKMKVKVPPDHFD